MSEFKRDNKLFSLCGLNCGLCTMNLGGYCPGCGQGPGNQICAIARCSMDKNIQYCFECDEFPCERYNNIDEYDSFVTHQNQLKDLKKFQEIGIDKYNKEQERKIEILKYLLDNYNDGRKKTFFSLAINLLDLEDIERIMKKLDNLSKDLDIKEKSQQAAKLFNEVANREEIILKLRKRPKDNK